MPENTVTLTVTPDPAAASPGGRGGPGPADRPWATGQQHDDHATVDTPPAVTVTNIHSELHPRYYTFNRPGDFAEYCAWRKAKVTPDMSLWLLILGIVTVLSVVNAIVASNDEAASLWGYAGMYCAFYGLYLCRHFFRAAPAASVAIQRLLFVAHLAYAAFVLMATENKMHSLNRHKQDYDGDQYTFDDMLFAETANAGVRLICTLLLLSQSAYEIYFCCSCLAS